MKLDKKQRTIMQTMTRQELFGLISHFCREKAENMEMLQEAHGVLSILEAQGGSYPSLSDRDGRNLRKTLARMNFSNLIGLALHRAGSSEDAVAAQRLSEAFDTWCQEGAVSSCFCLNALCLLLVVDSLGFAGYMMKPS